NQVLEHLIGRDLPHFLPDQVLEHCSTLFLAHFQRARVLFAATHWRSLARRENSGPTRSLAA
ncbi:MAG: hypothetical protein J6Y32_02705, partial [Bacteroidales bacterium]|nr:hypothetical protein [Bacteroidales bacterium]